MAKETQCINLNTLHSATDHNKTLQLQKCKRCSESDQSGVSRQDTHTCNTRAQNYKPGKCSKKLLIENTHPVAQLPRRGQTMKYVLRAVRSHLTKQTSYRIPECESNISKYLEDSNFMKALTNCCCRRLITQTCSSPQESSSATWVISSK